MTPSGYTEDTLVQQTTADYLQHQLGWESVYAYNNEDFGPDSLLGRTSDREVVLIRTLRRKLIELNPDMPDEAYDDAVRQITATAASQTIAATNREKHDLIRDDVQVTFKNDKGKRVRQRLRVFDYNEPASNHFLCVRELWVRGDLYRKRADIVGFVNGIPLLFIECKNIHKNLKTAFEKNYSGYQDTIPHLFHHNAIVMFGNGEQAKIGSITSKWEHFHDWKRLSEQEPGVVDMETLLAGVCDKRNFMDLVENFILFDEASGETKKIIARNHQFLGVNRAIESMRSKPQFRNMQRMDLDEAFKEEEHPFRIAIVCAMWLTGFDVPCLSTLYLDGRGVTGNFRSLKKAESRRIRNQADQGCCRWSAEKVKGEKTSGRSLARQGGNTRLCAGDHQ
ncbi:MAG: type I restriction endonuclease [Euryarchaeota archaeon]|nr:type I restriction endonuclease [Euryarchaeota archaeon]